MTLVSRFLKPAALSLPLVVGGCTHSFVEQITPAEAYCEQVDEDTFEIKSNTTGPHSPVLYTIDTKRDAHTNTYTGKGLDITHVAAGGPVDVSTVFNASIEEQSCSLNFTNRLGMRNVKGSYVYALES